MWNYRVIEFVEPSRDPWRAIHEVFYDDEGRPEFYSEEPAGVVAGTDESLSSVLDMMRSALDRPVLTETDFRREPSGDADK